MHAFSRMTMFTARAYRFTGKERDAESDNDFFGARYYASAMGRFMSPDPSGLVLADQANPQSLNLYSYALNNPLRMIDPTGLTACFYGGVGDTPENDHDSTDYEDVADEQTCTQNGGVSLVNDQTVNVNGDDPGNYISTLDGGGSSIFVQFVAGKSCAQAALRGMVAHTEGMDNYPNGGYGSFVSGTVISAPDQFNSVIGASSNSFSFADPGMFNGHPPFDIQVRQGLNSDAFGRYQIMGATARAYNFNNFSPAGQDAAANKLLSIRNMVGPAMKDDIATAVSRGSNEWASLPGNSYGQGGVNLHAAIAAYYTARQSAPECK